MVYLIHFDKPYRHAKHYIGYTEEEDVSHRLERHRKGNGARLLQVVVEAGIAFSVVKIWKGLDRETERKIKNQKN